MVGNDWRHFDVLVELLQIHWGWFHLFMTFFRKLMTSVMNNVSMSPSQGNLKQSNTKQDWKYRFFLKNFFYFSLYLPRKNTHFGIVCQGEKFLFTVGTYFHIKYFIPVAAFRIVQPEMPYFILRLVSLLPARFKTSKEISDDLIVIGNYCGVWNVFSFYLLIAVRRLET